MPQTQSAVRGVYDFGAPATEAAVLAFRVRNQMGGKVDLKFENMVGSQDQGGPVTYSVQVAPEVISGDRPVPGTFVDTAAATNLETVVDVVVDRAQSREHTILLRPGVDQYVMVVASGSARAQMIVTNDRIWDLVEKVDGVFPDPPYTPA